MNICDKFFLMILNADNRTLTISGGRSRLTAFIRYSQQPALCKTISDIKTFNIKNHNNSEGNK
jgi:hypothetical protein